MPLHQFSLLVNLEICGGGGGRWRSYIRNSNSRFSSSKLIKELNMTNTTLITYSSSFLLFSVTKFIRTGIADKDDYPLFFEKAFYETEVDENEEINHPLLTVTARAHNECKYKGILLCSSALWNGWKKRFPLNWTLEN